MRLLFAYGLLLGLVTPISAQVIKFQSAGFGGTTTNVAGTTTKHSMAVGGTVSQAAGQANRAGFFWGNLDYRPAQQATGITFSSLASNQLTLTWGNGNGTRRIVVARSANPVSATVASSTFYTANAAFGSGGTEIGAASGNFAVYEGTGNSISITNLTPSTIYHFKVFEYNGKYGVNNSNIEYQPGTVTGNPASRTTLALAPATPASGLVFSNVTKNQSTISWTNGNGTNRILVAKQGNVVNATPVNGQPYTASAIFGSGADLGSSNFVTFNGSTNQATVTGLLPNTVYHYQVFEFKGSGADNNYLIAAAPVSSKLTLTAEPLAQSATIITQSTFSANWQQVIGAGNYYIDVSADPGFTTFVPGFQNKSISGGALTASINGLNSGTTYYYIVRAENASGQSANSNVITALTVPATPTVLVSTAISTTGFTANWSASASATDYFVDVATDAAFTQLVSGFENKQVTGLTSLEVTGLTSGTSYFIRIRSKNGSGISPNIVGFNQFTITNPPTALDAANEQKNSFKAKWTTVSGATEYELNVEEDNTGISINGYPKLLPHPQTEEIVTGLTSSTKYRYYIRGKNAGGFSATSNVILAYTLTDDGKIENRPVVTINASSTISSAVAQVSGGELPRQITFKHRSITGSKFIAEAVVTLTTGTHTQPIDAAWLDELGLEYYFVVKDAANRYDSTNATSAINGYAYRSFSSQGIVGFESGFNGTPASYKMFSIPANLSDNSITNLFQPVLSQFGKDKSKWRMFHYPGGMDKPYQEFDTDLNKIEPGRGYWFNAVEVPDALEISDEVIRGNQSDPFELDVEVGWNQIGNPYPFSIDWTNVKNVNTAAELKSLWVFDKSISNYRKTDVLQAWQGAFVFSGKGGTVQFPVLAKTNKTGRSTEFDYPNLPDEGIWHLTINLEHGGLKNIGSVGMHPEASNSMDKFDELTVPRFINYLEMKTRHEEYFAHNFSEDVVTTSDHYTWTFTIASNVETGNAEFSWDPSAWSGTSSVLLLLDVSQQVLLDMKTTYRYGFPFGNGKQFKLIYSKDARFNPGVTLLGEAYPNPFTNHVQIPVLVDGDNSKMKLEIYDVLGKRIKVVDREFNTVGLHHFEWDGMGANGEEIAAGLLLYRLTRGSDTSSVVKRLLKVN